MTRRSVMGSTACIAWLCSGGLVADSFSYRSPGQLTDGSGTGYVDCLNYAPNIVFPLRDAPAYANSQLWGEGGLHNPGSEDDSRNYSYPWQDNFCETRGRDADEDTPGLQSGTPFCPDQNGSHHAGQDIRASTFVGTTAGAVYLVVAAQGGRITHLDRSYSRIDVRHADGVDTYLHMREIPASLTTTQGLSGNTVVAGQTLGRVWNVYAPDSTSKHLHWERSSFLSDFDAEVPVPPYMALVQGYRGLIGRIAEGATVRTTASTSVLGAPILGGGAPITTKPAGSLGRIVAGPETSGVNVGCWLWWLIEWSDGVVGWSIDNELVAVVRQPTNLGQFEYSDLSHPVQVGRSVAGSGVSLLGTVASQSGENVRLEIELRSDCNAFSGDVTDSSGFVPSGGTPEIDLANLPDGNYRWRARARTSSGARSAWVSFGGNADSTPDFLVQMQQCIVPCDAASLVEKQACQAPVPSVALAANPASITAGSSTTLSWSSVNTTSCVASGGWGGSKPTSGSATVTPSGTTTYTLTCSGPLGSAQDDATVTVTGSTSSAAVYLSAFPENVSAGATVGLGWATSNAVSCVASGGWSGPRPLSGGTTVTPAATTTYTLTCTGTTGGSASDSVTVTVTSSTPTVNLAVNPPAINPGGSATLQWSTSAMTSCSASGGWSGSKALNGSQQVSPGSTTTYILNCTGVAPTPQELARNGKFSGNVSEWTVTGKFFANSVYSFCNFSCPGYAYLSDLSGSLSLSNNLFGTMRQDISLPSTASAITLSFWVSISTLETTTTTPFDGLSLTLQNTQGTPLQLIQTFSNLNAGGYRQTTFNLTPYKGQTVRLQFVGTTDATRGTIFRVDDVSVLAAFPSQQYSDSAKLTVSSPSPPGLTFAATPNIVSPGQSSTLAWVSSNTTSCTASNGWSGTKPTSGNQVVTPNSTTNYTISCSGSGGTISDTVTVVVQSLPAGLPINVVTAAADGITQTSALLHGGANPNGAETSAIFLYGPFPALGFSSNSKSLGSSRSDQTFAIGIDGLSCDTTYQYLAEARNALGESDGAARQFRTSPCSSPSSMPLDFYTITACRAIDTGLSQSPLLSGTLAPRWFQIAGVCAIPQTAQAVSLNVTAVNPTQGGYVTLFPADQGVPDTSSVSFRSGQVRANNAIVKLSPDGKVAAVAALNAAGQVDLLVDVNGYFAPVAHELGFAPRIDLPTGSAPLGLVVTDLDGDGRKDVAVTIYDGGNGDRISILRNTGTVGQVQFAAAVDVTTGRGPEGIAAGDLDNDGKPELVTANAADSTVRVFKNSSTPGNMDFDIVLPLMGLETAHRVAIADFDQDGRPDLLVTSNNTRKVVAYHHASDPAVIAFDYSREFNLGYFLNFLEVADIDRDSKPDLLLPIPDTGGVRVFRNDSSPGNIQAVALPDFAGGTAPARGIAVADLNNDQALDVVVAGTGSISVFRNFSSPGAFNLARADLVTGTNLEFVAIGDLDRDGLRDVVASNADANTLTLLRNTSSGVAISLTPQPSLPTGLTPIDVVLSDVDGDGWLDLVVANHGGADISVILNTSAQE